MKREERKRLDIDENALDRSLDLLSPEDLAPAEEKKGFGPRAVIRGVLLALSLGVFACSSVYLVQYLTSKVMANSTYDDLRDLYYSESDAVTANGELVNALPDAASLPLTGDIYNYKEENNRILLEAQSRMRSLRAVNPDAFGWLKVEGTRIDYPVVRGEDNEFYLDHAFDRRQYYTGALFADCNNSMTLLDNRNTVIYGHNMNDGSMFHTLLKFRYEKMFNDGTVELTTSDGVFTYEVFSAHVVKENETYFATKFNTDWDFIAFAERMQDQSLYNKGLKFSANDRILTLSTCTNMRSDERFAIHAVLISQKTGS